MPSCSVDLSPPSDLAEKVYTTTTITLDGYCGRDNLATSYDRKGNDGQGRQMTPSGPLDGANVTLDRSRQFVPFSKETATVKGKDKPAKKAKKNNGKSSECVSVTTNTTTSTSTSTSTSTNADSTKTDMCDQEFWRSMAQTMVNTKESHPPKSRNPLHPSEVPVTSVYLGVRNAAPVASAQISKDGEVFKVRQSGTVVAAKSEYCQTNITIPPWHECIMVPIVKKDDFIDGQLELTVNNIDWSVVFNKFKLIRRLRLMYVSIQEQQ